MTITREELLTIAHQKGCVTAVNPETGGSFLNFTSDDLMNFANHFYELGRNMQMESDAQAVENEYVGDSIIDKRNCAEDQAYNTALQHAAEAIRNNTGDLT